MRNVGGPSGGRVFHVEGMVGTEAWRGENK